MAFRGLLPALALAGHLLGALQVPACGLGGPNTVTGQITPAHFRFQTTVPDDGKDEGAGWRAVCIHATMKNAITGASVICKFEVGTPLRNLHGRVKLEHAQEVAAETANASAHAVLSRYPPEAPLGPACLEFREAMESLLRKRIDGCRVGACVTPGLTPVHFDPQ